MSATQTYTGTLVIIECAGCSIAFGITKRFRQDRRDDHKTFYCPRGDSNHYPQKNVEEELRAQLAREEGRVAVERAANARTRERLDAERRSHAATKGHLTRMRTRIAAGVCPVPGCRRSGFAQVMRHLAAKHPVWLAEHAHDIEVA